MVEINDDSRPESGAEPLELKSDYASLVESLSLPEKISLLTGETTWSSTALERIGLRPIVMSDGGVGVRLVDSNCVNLPELLPNPSAIGACWDREAARLAGELIGRQAHNLHVNVLLAPQVNLQRTPLAGRFFECFSEDPYLTADLAVGFVEGVQSNGVAACPKHYVANECETDRTTAVSVVGERVLRESYLIPFEALVRAGAWSIMAAYNAIDDGVERASATEHEHLLRTILKEEWAFDGVVISDWTAARSTLATARAGLDLVMPGPGGPWGESLLESVLNGQIDESLIDEKISRILRLADRVGAIGSRGSRSLSDLDGRAICRSLAARSMVLLKNDDSLLPMEKAAIGSVALVGPNARELFIQGGGSSNLGSRYRASLSEEIASRFPDLQCWVESGVVEPQQSLCVGADRCSNGDRSGVLSIREISGDGQVLSERAEFWDGKPNTITAGTERIEISGSLDLREPGIHRLGLATAASMELWCDGRLLEQQVRELDDGVNIDSSFEHPTCQMHEVVGAQTVTFKAVVEVFHSPGWGDQVYAQIRHAVPTSEDPLERAVRAVERAERTVLVLGTNEHIESEGWDRKSLDLPEEQNELARAVLNTNPNALVVINAGGPLELPWIDSAKTVLWCWLPGQEGASALLDVLIGDTEPSGRLPWTLPCSFQDIPLSSHGPVSGETLYSEGVHVGYRAWAEKAPQPEFSFGHGLGWGNWEYTAAALRSTGRSLAVEVQLKNLSSRTSLESVQVYARCLSEKCSYEEHQDLRLVGHQRARVEPEQQLVVDVKLWERALAVWEPGNGWHRHSGTYELCVGRSFKDLRIRWEVKLDGDRFGEEPLGQRTLKEE